MQWYPEQCSLWCTAALSNLHLICMLFVWGPAQPRGTWSLHRGGGGGTSFTPHTVTLTAGHLAAVPGGSDLAQPKRVFLTATVRGHEMTSYRWLLVLANTRCGVYADVGRGQDLVLVWHLVRAVAILCLPCMLRLSYSGTLCALFCQLIDVFMLHCQATNSLNRGPSTISK